MSRSKAVEIAAQVAKETASFHEELPYRHNAILYHLIAKLADAIVELAEREDTDDE